MAGEGTADSIEREVCEEGGRGVGTCRARKLL